MTQLTICPTCGKIIDPDKEFKDALSKKEYTISGMCQECQDSVFDCDDADEFPDDVDESNYDPYSGCDVFDTEPWDYFTEGEY